MVVFTISYFLNPISRFFAHNVFGSIYIGDFILGLFVFGSGASVPYFIKSREKLPKLTIYLDLTERLIKLFLVSFISTPLFAGIYALDEVLLNAVVFTIVFLCVSYLSEVLLYVILTILILGYFALIPGLFSFFSPSFYLGGYLSVPFYLIIGILGYLFSNSISQAFLVKFRYLFFLLCISFLLLLFPPLKLLASPTFMIASALIATFLFLICEIISKAFSSFATISFLEYLGSKSLRIWLMMIFLFLLPALIYTNFYQKIFLDEVTCVVISFCFIGVCFYISKLIDDLNLGFVNRWKL